jgi:hypothetical protein
MIDIYICLFAYEILVLWQPTMPIMVHRLKLRAHQDRTHRFSSQTAIKLKLIVGYLITRLLDDSDIVPPPVTSDRQILQAPRRVRLHRKLNERHPVHPVIHPEKLHNVLDNRQHPQQIAGGPRAAPLERREHHKDLQTIQGQTPGKVLKLIPQMYTTI